MKEPEVDMPLAPAKKPRSKERVQCPRCNGDVQRSSLSGHQKSLLCATETLCWRLKREQGMRLAGNMMWYGVQRLRALLDGTPAASLVRFEKTYYKKGAYGNPTEAHQQGWVKGWLLALVHYVERANLFNEVLYGTSHIRCVPLFAPNLRAVVVRAMTDKELREAMNALIALIDGHPLTFQRAIVEWGGETVEDPKVMENLYREAINENDERDRKAAQALAAERREGGA